MSAREVSRESQGQSPMSGIGKVIRALVHSAKKLLRPLKDRLTRSGRLATALGREFDPVWYREKYLTREHLKEPLQHYLTEGIGLGYSPNGWFDEKFYLAFYPDVAEARSQGRILCGFQHYLEAGRREDRVTRHDLRVAMTLRSEFDPVWYREKYLTQDCSNEPLRHYLAEGTRLGYSPNGWFDEKFYLAFYPDVAEACNEGRVLCGFHHYLESGRKENRVPRHELQECLEARLPGVTRPLLLDRVGDLARRLEPIPAVKVARAPTTVWALLPTLNPDITFGGYHCAIELIKALVRRGHTVAIICCAERSNMEYFQYCKGEDSFGSGAENLRLVNRIDLSSPIEVGVNDRFIAYSCWEAHLAHGLASLTNEPRFVSLVQEYEPAFHDYGSEHAIVSSAYDLPHFPIFNSDALRYFFEQAKFGIFGKRQSEGLPEYIVMEHVRARVPAPTREGMARNGRPRRLVMYARPEQHAARNLFPLGILGLSRAIERGVLTGSWEMSGIGALSVGQKVRLPRDYELILKPKMLVEEYAQFIAATDVGISLMYAPHPGLVSFELAEAGVRVVTNTFGSRSSEYLRSISENLVPCDPTIEGIAEGIGRAVGSLDDIESRLRGANIPGPRSWDEVFGDKFFDKLSGLFAIGAGAERKRPLPPNGERQ